MRKFIAILILACAATLASAQTLGQNPTNKASMLRNKILSGDKSSVIVVAHRGDWRYAPENSIAAIEHSIASGVDVVELDLQLTKDSVLIIMHDTSLNRTTTGKGAVSAWTLDSIKTLKLKNGCNIKTKHTVPTLEEAMLAAKDKVLVNLDKADRYFDLVVAVLEKTGTTHQVIMKGAKSAEDVKNLYGKYLDKIIYMPVVNLDKDNATSLMDGYMANLKPAAYELTYGAVIDDRLPLKLKDDLNGKALIWYNTLWDTLCGGHDDDLSLDDPHAAFGFLIDNLGATIIQTDRAEHLLKYLRSRGLHD
ncbi:MAG: glycerophosphodiester phosphodiesterase family protein [Muribaculaceae bacterium]|nr:glycerophosphodiester phosphodiesterase family protein [Muribaculaceae bacterium]